MRRALGFFAPLGLVSSVVVASCGGGEKPTMVPIDGARGQAPTADVSELEIRGDGVDRFATCPPPGDLGQHWIPPLFPYTPPAEVDAGAPEPLDEAVVSRTKDRTNTEQAVEATHRDFRSCYRRSLIHDPTQDGRVAIVLRIGASGRVSNVEEYAACELAPDAIACMKHVASRLRFVPPKSGADTVTIPATFTSRDGIKRTTSTSNDKYTAGAYLTLESARPALHACEAEARRALRPIQATGTFTLVLASDGRVTKTHVDPWSGEKTLLACAAKALEALTFAPPPGGKGTVIARLNFNPRQGTR